MKIIASLLFFAAAGLLAQVPQGDEAFSRRAEGSNGSHAAAPQIDAAIAAYRTAAQRNPNDLEARWKLLRATRFKAAYTISDIAARRDLLAGAKKTSEEMLNILQRTAATRGVKSLSGDDEKKVAAALRGVPNAAEAFYWDAVTWGEWALAYGKMAAARQGAADRIKRSATLAMLIDPAAEGGGGARVLGRLHNQTPRIPFITGWASNDQAIKFLRDSVARDPKNKLTRVFLAEALLDGGAANNAAAQKMLRDVIAEPIDATLAVEDAAAKDDAKRLLTR